MGKPSEWVGLIHELRKLRSSEELLNRRDHRANVNQRLWRNCLNILGGHALTHDPLHPGQARTNLILNEFTHSAKAAVTKVVDVISFNNDRSTWCFHRGVPRVQAHEVLDCGNNVLNCQSALL